MTKLNTILIAILFSMVQCKVPSVELTNRIDPDIVLVNIEEGNRAFIGKLLLTIDSCRPTLIAIDILFRIGNNRSHDSVLINALKTVKNDILVYNLDREGKYLEPDLNCRPFVSGEGLLEYRKTAGLISSTVPIREIKGKIHESFSLKIVQHWKHNFRHDIKGNQPLQINYTRALEHFIQFNGSELRAGKHFSELNNKIVLLGYIGPSDEDKQFTPIRLVKEYADNEPDTYGLVIIANEIRTIMQHQK